MATAHVTHMLCVHCMFGLTYLHGILLPVDGVFGAGSSVVAPVQVELHSLVAAGQVSARDVPHMRNPNLNWRGHTP